MPTLLPHISRNLATRLAASLSAFTWGSVPGGTISVSMQRKPDYGLEDLGSLRVSVVPGPYTMKTETRGMEVADVTVGIVVAKHVGSESDIEALEDLCQEIVDAIRSNYIQPAGLPENSDWTEVGNPLPYDPELLEARNVFMAQIAVQWDVPVDKWVPVAPTGPTGATGA
jgi:hypothetical protein